MARSKNVKKRAALTVFISAAIFFGAAAVSEDPALGADTGIPADRDVVIQMKE